MLLVLVFLYKYRNICTEMTQRQENDDVRGDEMRCDAMRRSKRRNKRSESNLSYIVN